MGAGTKLRQVMAKDGLVQAMAAHSPLSAMLAAEAGFDAIWASGFELSALHGLPDVSLVSMTQHLDTTRAMVDRGGLPVVADIDTGSATPSTCSTPLSSTNGRASAPW